MSRRVSCPQGHQWELPEQETAAVVSCPVCGQSTKVSEQNAPSAGGPRTPSDPMETTAPDFRTAPLLSTAPPSWPTLAGYEIIEELGQGGMGVVYKARQLSLQRIVAIKLMGNSSTVSAARFKIEAEAVAHLQHANIVQIYEVGEQEGRSFLALEFIDGGNLSQKLSKGPLDPYEAARLVETLARALHHAHERGILHRDIKPGNVLLTAEGLPKITDFGLAKRLEGPGVTQTGQGVLGTPSYMAPEQAEGKSKKLGPAVDVYALGATLYEALTGRPPFREDTPLETMLKVTREEPLSPSQLRPTLPRDLETICLKCLNKSPSLRYPSALALADDLRRFIDGESIHARPPSTWERIRRALRRNREKVVLTLGGAAVIGLLMVLLWPRQPSPGNADAGPQGKPPEPALDLPRDLAFIPRNGHGFIALKMAEILAREDLLELYRVIARKLPLGLAPSPELLGAQIQKKLGVRPTEITRVSLVLFEQQDAPAKKSRNKQSRGLWDGFFGEESPVLAIVTTAQPYDRLKLQNLYPGPAEMKKLRDTDYVVFPDPDAPTLCFLTDQIFAVCEDEIKIREFLEGKTGLSDPSALDEALLLAKDHPFVVAVRPRVERDKEVEADLKRLLANESGNLGELVPKVRAFLEAETFTFTLDWDFRTTKGDLLQYTFYSTYADEAKAKKGLEGLDVFRKAMLKALAEVQAEFKRVEAQLKEAAKTKELTTLPVSAWTFMAAFLGEMEVALRAARPQIQGRKIQVQLQMRLEIPELFASLGEATTKVRKAVARTQTMNNLRQVGLALERYQSEHGRLPPAVSYSKGGQPLYSWRVEVLPYLGEDEKKLYEQFKRDEPWDSPHNKKLLARMPPVYAPSRAEAGMLSIGSIEVPLAEGSSWLASLGSAGMALIPGQSRLGWGSSLMPFANPLVRKDPYVTYLQVPVGAGCAFEGKTGLVLNKDFPDGIASTILLVEGSEAVQWTRPADASIDPKRALPRLGAAPDEGFPVLLGDNSVLQISRQVSERDLRALFTRNGGEKVDINKLP